MVAMWQGEEAQKCPTCGRYDWEQEEGADAPDWQAGLHLCLFCKSVEELRDEAARDRKGLPSEGLKLRLYAGGVDDGSVP